MPVSDKNSVYTIGHSTHSLAEFIGMLESFQVKVLVDIRALPGSGSIHTLIKKIYRNPCPKTASNIYI